MVFRSALIAAIVLGVGGCGFNASESVGPDVFFEVEQSLTDESIPEAQLLVRLSERTEKVVTVDYSVSGGSAMSGRDFTLAEGTLTFEPFQETAMVAITIIDDGMEEEEEDIKVSLKSPKNAVLGDVSEHRLRISAQKLPRVRFVSASSEAGEQAGPQGFAIQLDTLPLQDVIVRYTWAGTAEQGDHGVVNGMLTIRANQISEQLPAPITNDLTDEDDETIDLQLIGQEGAVVAPGLGIHSHKILDDDPPPNIGFSVAASSVDETGTTANLAVTLALASEKTITVDYAAAAGSAVATDDFTLAAGTLTFPPGTTTLNVPVTIANDAIDEENETLTVTLSNASNANLQGNTQHALTITDDDAPPQLAFQQAASAVNEGTATHAVTVVLSAPSGRTIQFSVTRPAGAAADLSVPAGAITIPPGTTQVSFNATITNDTTDEVDEDVVLSLTGLVNAAAGGQATHTVTIQDNDDAPQARFDPATPNQTADERDQTPITTTYRVILSAASAKQVTVNVNLGGTASANDYDIGTGDIPVVFAPGETSKNIRVTADPDNQPEPDETVTLTLANPANATLAGDNTTRTHTIRNDD